MGAISAWIAAGTGIRRFRQQRTADPSDNKRAIAAVNGSVEKRSALSVASVFLPNATPSGHSTSIGVAPTNDHQRPER